MKTLWTIHKPLLTVLIDTPSKSAIFVCCHTWGIAVEYYAQVYLIPQHIYLNMKTLWTIHKPLLTVLIDTPSKSAISEEQRINEES